MITLYTIGCPKCKILEKKLIEKNIKYIIINDEDILKQLNIDEVPKLLVNNQLYNFGEAIKWINNLNGDENGEYKY